jgi:hypothetical protein
MGEVLLYSGCFLMTRGTDNIWESLKVWRRSLVLTCSCVVVWDMRSFDQKSLQKANKAGRKVNSNKITTRGVITGKSHVGRLPKIVRELTLCWLKK